MNYPKCKFYIKYDRCSHRSAPAPYHSRCLGKKGCLVRNNPIEYQALNPTSPIQNAAQEMYDALKGLCLAYHIDEHSIILNQDPEYWQRALKALTKAKGRG